MSCAEPPKVSHPSSTLVSLSPPFSDSVPITLVFQLLRHIHLIPSFRSLNLLSLCSTKNTIPIDLCTACSLFLMGHPLDCHQSRKVSVHPPPPTSHTHTLYSFSAGQSLSCVWLFVTPWTAAHQASPSITNSRSLLRLMSTESVMPSNHLIPCHPLLFLPSIFPSIRVFSSESVLRIRWPKYWSFSFSFSPSNEYSGLISFRMDWFDPLAVQRTLKSLFQHHSSKASILQRSAFFIVQL